MSSNSVWYVHALGTRLKICFGVLVDYVMNMCVRRAMCLVSLAQNGKLRIDLSEEEALLAAAREGVYTWFLLETGNSNYFLFPTNMQR